MSENDFIYADVVKQNDDIIKKYNLKSESSEYYSLSIETVCDIIKMLEVKLFSAEASLKLAMELNAIYENDIRVFKKNIVDLQKFINENVPAKTSYWVDENNNG